jgi:hypothetical protein
VTSYRVSAPRLSYPRLGLASASGRDDPPSAPGSYPSPEAASHLPPLAKPPRKGMIYLAVVVVVAILVVAGIVVVFVAPRLAHHASTDGVTLAPVGQSYDVFAGQDAVISFTLNATTTLSGAFTAYVLDTTQYEAFVHTGNVTSSQWASGEGNSGSISDQLTAGSWNLAFIDLNPQATSVYISGAITLTPG